MHLLLKLFADSDLVQKHLSVHHLKAGSFLTGKADGLTEDKWLSGLFHLNSYLLNSLLISFRGCNAQLSLCLLGGFLSKS